MALELVYDGKFKGNILAVRRTSCGKTSFVQRLCVNNIFGELEKIEWISKSSGKWSDPAHFLKAQGKVFLSFLCALFLHIFDT